MQLKRPQRVCYASFHFQTSAPADTDSSDITWGLVSDFTLLPLEPQQVLYNPFSYMQEYSTPPHL